jgi:hypothetical protein
MAETLEDRIRERAYYLGQASGRPAGRDEELWYRACDMVAADGDQPRPRSKRLQSKQAKPALAPATT